MLGYLGGTTSLATLVDDPPHSLVVQSYKARELEGAVVNADGWGAAWYLPDDAEPVLYRSTLPIWADVNRTHLGRAARSAAFLAAVRSATDPLGISAANTQPFAHGPLTFLHNGYVRDFSTTLLRPLREALTDATYSRVEGNTDSEHVFAALVDAYDRTEGPERLVNAVRATVQHVLRLAEQWDTRALLTLIVSDGEQLVATRTAVGGNPPSLYVLSEPTPELNGVVLASEPLDESPSWQAVAPHSLVIATRGMPPSLSELP